MIIKNPIQELLIRNGGTVATELIAADPDDLMQWHLQVQPFVIKEKRKPDAGWNWPLRHKGAVWYEEIRGRHVHLYQYLVIGTDLRGQPAAIPVGQVMLSCGFEYCMDRTKKCVLLWLLAGAPREAQKAYGLPDTKILKPLIDVAIQCSIELGFEGRIMLHADKGGGQNLMDQYIAIGLKSVPKVVTIYRLPLNDGRYFHLDEQAALAFASKLDQYR